MSPAGHEGDPFGALADPTRRHILELLVRDGPSTATALAGQLDISRQAVAKHLQLLAGAGVAESARVGRETRFEARTAGFDDIRRWLAQVESDWQGRLDRLSQSLSRAEAPDTGDS
ncbi:MAG: metalloregulator ArsR/SmtB family transcription factor [Actinomycetota bacterium]